MKKLLLLFALLFAGFYLHAQIPEGEMYRKGTKLLVDGQPLNAYMIMETVGADVYRNTYVSATKQINPGRALSGSGGVIAVSAVAYMGFALYSWRYNMWNVPWFNAAIGTGVVAGAFVSAGIPLVCIGSKRLDWIADEYNAGNAGGVTVEFGAQQNGVGLVLRF
ncbi:MAG: hypothetical protein MJY56_00865 [Bacteroidales bacterium]|nr:hypothetical protein [Bacteroidales bacterium]